eukprot:CAMPEP_0202963066 /NCGR_PEP_ID=MMETSP1396-20130829/7063_1 /ASSEMBLY_ACC=CAM_ASM_000872 /TAXON_ID= /ORGANISM="Pseudokeronopsis sp., Strain Brazil" /LENGTH=246 /DNA_ID=CAMNT_0049683993 /DNA_START=371 /DNA_END=1111 /DNA_ORIENTATION=-
MIAVLHSFKLSKYFGRHNHAIIERVIEQNNEDYKTDRVLDLHPDPFTNRLLMSVLNISCSALLLVVNWLKLLQMEGFGGSFPGDLSYLVPYDTCLVTAFIAVQLNNSVYIGNTDDDYWQFFGLRTSPFVSFFGHLFIFSSHRLSQMQVLDMALISIMVFQTLYFSLYDCTNAFQNDFADIIEDNMYQHAKAPAKRVVVQKAEKRLKLIVYRESMDGGIQGILMDFFEDSAGNIANEFYRIAEDGEL